MSEGPDLPADNERPDLAADNERPDLPADNGARPSIDKAGQVHGSGVGAGGGQPGEDFDEDAASGDGQPPTGTEEKPAP